ncbi:MAG: hypothetical protein A2Y38_26195 [Spirochaetes bacterium GWB1_59_5]|nr:MAG: hypothetical protein A2Y38_26195 [Spirochaetes bacterium GWB1_59_5]
MDKNARVCDTVDQYIASFPEDVQDILLTIRAIITEEAPAATERIAYGMPTYTAGKNLIHFAAYAKHIGVYPTPSGMEAFKDELAAYKNAKGSVQFPLKDPIPYDLIRRIARYRVEEQTSQRKPQRKR